MLITELKIANDKDKYNEYLTKVEKVKFEMAEKYLLHPSNYKKRIDNCNRGFNLHFHYIWNNSSLVNEWDEDWQSSKRDWAIAQNGNVGYE